MTLNMGHEQSYSREEIAQFIDILWPYMNGEKQWATPDDEWEVHTQWAERKLETEEKD